MHTLAIYFSAGSSSLAPHIALHEIGAPFESRPISLAKKENRTAAFLALNPEGKVPTLLIDGRALTEVAAILFYLAKAFPDAGLLPEGDLEAQAQVVSWMSFVASTVHPARRQGADHARAVYAIADIHLFRLFWRFSNSLELSRTEFPNLFAHYDRMMARPAVQRTLEIEKSIGYELPA